MPGKKQKYLIHRFALWVAGGGKIAAWCKEHGVTTGTGNRWYKEDAVRRLVEEYRGRAVDRAIGRMARGLGKAVAKIVEPIVQGRTDAVKLAAAKALVEKRLDVRDHAELRAELKRLDERLESQEERRRARESEASETGSPGSRLIPAGGKPKESRGTMSLDDCPTRLPRPAPRPTGPIGSTRPGPVGRAGGR